MNVKTYKFFRITNVTNCEFFLCIHSVISVPLSFQRQALSRPVWAIVPRQRTGSQPGGRLQVGPCPLTGTFHTDKVGRFGLAGNRRQCSR